MDGERRAGGGVRGVPGPLRAAGARVRAGAASLGAAARRRRDPRPAEPERPPGRVYPPDFAPEDVALCRSVEGWTLTSPERIVALRDAVRYVVRRGVPGAIAECGVWRGGSMEVVARTLLAEGAADRDLHLFDTFTEMPRPGPVDVDRGGRPAILDWERQRSDPDPWVESTFGLIPEDAVRAHLLETGYPAERLHLVAGLVEETIPAHAPPGIALLRLDTDWYGSTRHELVHLYPRMAPGGVLIVDDYGLFRGARRAVDEYLLEKGIEVLLQRIDDAGRLVVLPG
ncbi:MAG TPA: TylF/MycF/NovP-related O-methyltransferase [Candidatus Dormibacteraeota bacterium]|nr:TylF/MycF/NovP-related O-methyltransferase [Candidatus Dormibacteraeota bacterium]